VKPLRASLRELLLGLLFIGNLGLQVELGLLRHADSAAKWIPHVMLFVGLLSLIAVYLRPTRSTFKALTVVMWAYLAVGLLGVYFHFRGNVEFALERDPSLTGLGLVWKALRGATPALAPGALAQLGLLGLLYSYRHPALAGDNIIERVRVETTDG
jgi:hypothetical protein